MNQHTTDHILCALWADQAIQNAIAQAKYGEAIVSHLRLLPPPTERRTKPAPDGVDIRQLHRQHCQPENAPIDRSGLLIAAFIVFVFAAVVIGSTIDFRGL